MEYKGKYLRLESKYGDRQALITELEEKFGLGVRQLTRGIGRVFGSNSELRFGFSQRDENNYPTNQFDSKTFKEIKKVYPLIDRPRLFPFVGICKLSLAGTL